MDTQIKRRIVGIVVLVLVMIILAPLLFNGSKRSAQEPKIPDVIPVAPPKPVIKSVDIASSPAIKRIKAVAVPVETVSPKKQTVKSRVVVKHVVKKVRPRIFVAKWMIQVASFSKKKNAQTLVKHLKVRRYLPYMRAVKGRKITVYRVYIKPMNAKQTPAKLLVKLRKEFKIRGIFIKGKK